MAFKHGHYIDSGRSSEEREKACISTEEEKLTSWDDVPLVCEDQDED